MRWRVGRKSVIGVNNVDLPQFSLVNYNTLSTIQVLASGTQLSALSLSHTHPHMYARIHVQVNTYVVHIFTWL